MMTSLVFRALDHQVIEGLADHPAVVDARGEISYAQLLHESASVAGALANLGIAAQTPVAIDLPPTRERVITVLACARVGAVPSTASAWHIAGVPPVLTTPEVTVEWDLLVRAGRTDPAPAPDADPEGYEDLLTAAYGDVFAELVAGGTIHLPRLT